MSLARGDRVGRIDSIRSRDVNGTRRAEKRRKVGNRSAVPGSSVKRENRPNCKKRKVRKSGPDPRLGWETDEEATECERANLRGEQTPDAHKHAGLPARAPNQDWTENRGDRALTTLDSTIMHFTDSTPAPSLRLLPLSSIINCFSTGRDETRREIDATRERSLSIVFVNLIESGSSGSDLIYTIENKKEECHVIISSFCFFFFLKVCFIREREFVSKRSIIKK